MRVIQHRAMLWLVRGDQHTGRNPAHLVGSSSRVWSTQLLTGTCHSHRQQLPVQMTTGHPYPVYLLELFQHVSQSLIKLWLQLIYSQAACQGPQVADPFPPL